MLASLTLRRSGNGPTPGRLRLVVTDIAALQQFWHVSPTQLDHVARLNHPQDSTLALPAFITNAPLHDMPALAPRLPRVHCHYPDVSMQDRQRLRHGEHVPRLARTAATAGTNMVGAST